MMPASSVKRRICWMPPKGTSLVEMLVVIAVSSILLGVVSVTLVAMYGISRNLQDADTKPWGSRQLVHHLRQDIAVSSRTEWDADAQLLTISEASIHGLEPNLITYEFAGPLCVRRFTNEIEEVVRQVFKLPKSVHLAVQPKVASSNTLIRLKLVSDRDADRSSRFAATNELVVQVGRNHGWLMEGGTR